MLKKEHPHAQALRWIADGEEIEARRQSKTSLMDWTIISCTDAISIIHYRETGWQFRIKPTPMCELAGVRFPVPMREEPKHGTSFWVASFSGVSSWHWEGGASDIAWLLQRLCHTNEEAAQAHSEAICAMNLMAIEGAK